MSIVQDLASLHGFMESYRSGKPTFTSTREDDKPVYHEACRTPISGILPETKIVDPKAQIIPRHDGTLFRNKHSPYDPSKPTIEYFRWSMQWFRVYVDSGLSLYSRDDKPATITVLGGMHWLNEEGTIHRDTNPAFIAGKIELVWITDGELFRKNGPARVTVWDYASFWDNGKFLGEKYSRLDEMFVDTESKRIDEQDVEAWREQFQIGPGQYDPFSERYFKDPQDELCYMSEFL